LAAGGRWVGPEGGGVAGVERRWRRLRGGGGQLKVEDSHMAADRAGRAFALTLALTHDRHVLA
jgi:hypothetical protein